MTLAYQLEAAATTLLLGIQAILSCATPKQREPMRISEVEARGGMFSGEEEFAEVAVVAPSFAGFYYAAPESDTLVVAVAKMDDAARAKEAVAALWLKRRRGPPGQPILVRQVNYSFLQLHRWRTAVEKKILALPQFSGLDLDEADNTVTVGVVPNGDRTSVHRIMRSAGVPTNAYRIVRLERGVLFHGVVGVDSTRAR